MSSASTNRLNPQGVRDHLLESATGAFGPPSQDTLDPLTRHGAGAMALTRMPSPPEFEGQGLGERDDALVSSSRRASVRGSRQSGRLSNEASTVRTRTPTMTVRD